MGCTLMGLTPEESFFGVTRNAASAIGQLNRRGTIDVGKVGDLCLWKCSSLVELSYYLGLNQLVKVFKNGQLVKEVQ
jgi:imidazolonepropionase